MEATQQQILPILRVTDRCRDCNWLLSGTRSTPHEYLLFTGRSEATGDASYQCLVCRAMIVNPGKTPDWHQVLPA